MKTRLAARIAIGWSACCFTGMVARGEDAVCNLPPVTESPAAGGWSGDFQTSWDVLMPSMPPTINIVGTWQGTLEFVLLRPPPREDPPAALPPAPPPNRQPLRPPGTPAAESAAPPDGARPGLEEQRAAIQAELQKRWEAEDAAVSRMARRFGSSTIHAGEIKGETRSSTSNSVNGMIDEHRVDAQGESTQDLEFDLNAVESDPTAGFSEIAVVNTRTQGVNSNISGAIVGPEMSGTMEYRASDGSQSNHVHAQGREYSVDEVHTGPADVIPLGEFAALTITESSCGLISGPVDASRWREMSQAVGVELRIQKAEWIAIHDDRDEAFEQLVERFANEPIPAEMTWEFAEHYAREFEALSAEAGADAYKQCLLVKARNKGLQITVAALQTLQRNVPRVRDGATKAVLREWRLRTLPLIRTLQLSGVGCALLEQAEDEFYAEMRELLKQVLARKHTLEELLEFHTQWQAGELGDLGPAYDVAVETALRLAMR